MKKYLLFFLAPLLMATQCEEDTIPVSRTNYSIENNSSIDLIFVTQIETQVTIPSQSLSPDIYRIESPNAATVPSDSGIFTEIKLFKLDANGDLVLAYEQNPVDDSLWTLSNLLDGDFRYQLVITDASLN